MIEVYNLLGGKHLCNIFASLIVNKINETFPDANTKISVINVRNFFVVKGNTNSDVVINLSDLLREFCLTYSEELANSIRVFDVINYNTEVDTKNLIISYSESKNNNSTLQTFVDGLVKEGVLLNLKIDDDIIYFDCSEKDLTRCNYDILNNFPLSRSIRKNFDFETYISDEFFGLSNNNEKYYHILLRYITYHLFKKGISSEITYKLSNIGTINEINNENVIFDIVSGKHIVNKDWLVSLILDVFPFELNELKERFDLSQFNGCDLYLGKNELIWEKLDLADELILF
jgi:hypothetical protein